MTITNATTNNVHDPSVGELTIKSATVHTASYFLVGLAAMNAFDYQTLFAREDVAAFMRPIDDPLVGLGLLFQPIRGALFGLVFFLVRDSLFRPRYGWLAIWALLVTVGIVNPFGPAPGSIEGLIYLRLEWSAQILPGLVEVGVQSLLLSLGVFYWVRQRQLRWIGWGFGALAAVGLLLPTAGLILAT